MLERKIVFKDDEIMILKRTFYGLIATTGIKKNKVNKLLTRLVSDFPLFHSI